MSNSGVFPGFSLPYSWLKSLLSITAQSSWAVPTTVQVTMDFIFADIVPQWRLNVNLEAKEANKLKLVVMLTASISYRGSSSKQPWRAWFEFFISAWFKLLTMCQSREARREQCKIYNIFRDINWGTQYQSHQLQGCYVS